jgi:hypothetical protein
MDIIIIMSLLITEVHQIKQLTILYYRFLFYNLWKFVRVRTNAEQPPLRTEYTNDNPNSPTSVTNRGRTIVDYQQVTDIADQESFRLSRSKNCFPGFPSVRKE